MNTVKLILATEPEVDSASTLYTFEVNVPHHVWTHFLTHRSLSRNAQSARAIPTKTLMRMADYTPERWYIAGKGMTPKEEAGPFQSEWFNTDWENARSMVLATCASMERLGCSKETVNRLLAPFSRIKGIITAEGPAWDAVFKLRITPDTQWETREICESIRDQIKECEPSVSKYHLPYTEDVSAKEHPTNRLMRISAARCARVSYLTHTGERDIEKDLDLCDRLIRDAHASPLEHPSVFDPVADRQRPSNFRGGWHQFRKVVGL